jgi:hypothetical protein
VLKSAVDQESGGQLGTFGEITLDKKSQAVVSLSREIATPISRFGSEFFFL